MPTLSHVLSVKGSDVASVEVSATVLEAVETMRRRRVGSVLVVNGGLLSGLFSERDAVASSACEESVSGDDVRFGGDESQPYDGRSGNVR